MTFGSLFAGIGGLDLGLERAGMKCRWQVEIDPYCRRVLTKHWPDVPKWDDVRTFPPSCHREQWRVDLICGGFPCQDISNAGQRQGIEGTRSGLWSEYVRIVRLLRPRYVLVENVRALLVRGIDRVLGDLAACGYDAEWQVLPAAAFGAPHIRERVFLLAYPDRSEHQEQHAPAEPEGSRLVAGTPAPRDVPDAGQRRYGRPQGQILSGRDGPLYSDWWSVEPDVGRVAHGVPSRVDRLRGLGNAVVPQIAEWIGLQILAFEASCRN